MNVADRRARDDGTDDEHDESDEQPGRTLRGDVEHDQEDAEVEQARAEVVLAEQDQERDEPGEQDRPEVAGAREVDCVEQFEQRLLDAGLIEPHEIEQVHLDAKEEVEAAVRQAVNEPKPTAADVLRHTYAPSPVDAVYPEDYTGLPN